jgi:hypothetical protein
MKHIMKGPFQGFYNLTLNILCNLYLKIILFSNEVMNKLLKYFK